MHVGLLGDDEVLITTDDSGHVTVHFTPLPSTRPPIKLKVPMSAWGIATNSQHRLVAISCNAHTIHVFHLGIGIPDWEWTTKPPQFEGDTCPSIVLKGHTQNIPCVALDESGRWLVSGSLDGSLVLWDVKSGSEPKKLAAMTRGPD